jgi:hypothetical protein
MEINIFNNTELYLKHLIEYQEKSNIFNHLKNVDEDISITIKNYFYDDNFNFLFKPIYKKVIDLLDNNCKMSSDTIYLSDRNDVTIDCLWIIAVRTNSFFYCLPSSYSINEPIESKFLKHPIEKINSSHLNYIAEQIITSKNGINLNLYDRIEPEEFQQYDSYICINREGLDWDYYAKKTI